MVTGTSVVGLVYKGGVMLAADTLLSYGTMAKSFNTPRMVSIDNRILLGASGEFSDFQEIVAKVEALALEETTHSMESLYEERSLSAKSLWNYLRAVMYHRRSKFNPFWNDVVVAGWDKDVPFLGVVDKIGTTLQENLVATGFGSYLAMPLLRERWTEFDLNSKLRERVRRASWFVPNPIMYVDVCPHTYPPPAHPDHRQEKRKSFFPLVLLILDKKNQGMIRP